MSPNSKKLSKEEKQAIKKEKFDKELKRVQKEIESIELVVDEGEEKPCGPNQVRIPINDKVIKTLMCNMANVETVEEIDKELYETYARQALEIYVNQIIVQVPMTRQPTQ